MTQDLTARIEALLPLVAKPTRYLGNEFHVRRKEARPGMTRWCLVLPEVYEIGMSHWGLKILYDLLNSHPEALAERAFAPWFDMESRLRESGIPLFSLESKSPLRSFDLVGFSLQYELTYTNLLNCLDLGEIPLRSRDRGEGHPLIAAGGPCATNPEPLADFIDLFLIGDAEEAVLELTDAYARLRGRPRDEILRELAQVEGVYVPSLYRPEFGPDGRLAGVHPVDGEVPPQVGRRFVQDLDSAPWPETPLVPLQGIVQDRLAVEVLRGCTHGCRFCQAGYFYRPVRERSATRVLELADKGIRASGWSEIGLVSLSTADHTQIRQMADLLNARFRQEKVGISLPSLRADSFSMDLAQAVGETKKSGFTFAPEAGSERLRRVLNKPITDAAILEAAEAAYSRGWRLIKLYFMIGLPTERWEDIEAIPPLVEQIRQIGRRHGPSCAVNVSVGSFVPKSHTPFQWDAFEGTESLRRKIEYLKGKIHSRWTRLKWHQVETSHLEAVFSMGDRRLGNVLEAAFRAGARFDGWTEHFDYGLWMRCFEEAGLEPSWFTRARGFEEPLPWDIIDVGIKRSWFRRERERAAEAETREDGGLLPDCRFGDCSGCGIPGMPLDTRLAPELTEEALEDLKKAAAALAPRTQSSGFTWPVRLTFEKRSLSRFLSHLEMTSVLGRAFRAARIPIAYSQGHKPHPKLSFGPPLPVGVEGAAEMVDVELHEPWTQPLQDRLNSVLPEGMRVLEGRAIPVVPGLRRISLSAAAQCADYRIDLSSLPEERRAAMAGALREFEEAGSYVVERSCWTPASGPEPADWESAAAPESADGRSEDQGGSRGSPRRGGRRPDIRPETAPRRVDLKRAVTSIEQEANAAGTLEVLGMRIFLLHPEGQTANPRIVLEQLFRLSPEEQGRVRMVRERLLGPGGEPVT